MRSAYHVREFEVFQLKQLVPGNLDIFLSHDWPTDIANFGNLPELLRRKPFLRDEINCGSFGSPAAAELLQILQPSFWFSAHLHVLQLTMIQSISSNIEPISSSFDRSSIQRCIVIRIPKK
jgi:lariat debranching enzyme